jgi:hypothetical protein
MSSNHFQVDLRGVNYKDSMHIYFINKALIHSYLKTSNQTDFTKFDFELGDEMKFRITRWEYTTIDQPTWDSLAITHHNTYNHVDFTRELISKSMRGHKTIYYHKSINYTNKEFTTGVKEFTFANHHYIHDLDKLVVIPYARALSTVPPPLTNRENAVKISNIFVNITNIVWSSVGGQQKRSISIYYTVSCMPRFKIRIDIIFKIIYHYDPDSDEVIYARYTQPSVAGTSTGTQNDESEEPEDTEESSGVTSALDASQQEPEVVEEVIVPINRVSSLRSSFERKKIYPSIETMKDIYDIPSSPSVQRNALYPLNEKIMKSLTNTDGNSKS